MSVIEIPVHWENTVDLNFRWVFRQFDIRVLRDDEKHEARNLLREGLKNDPIISALGFDKAATESLIKFINKHDQNIRLGCFTKMKKIKSARNTSKLDETASTSTTEQEEWTEPKLVAVDMLYVRNSRDKYPELNKKSDDAFIKWLIYTKNIERIIWSMGEQKICNFLTSFGVFVSKEFQSYGIPKEMLKNRKKLAAMLLIDVTGAAIIGRDEQHYAEDIKYEIIHELNNEELALDNASSADLETIFPIVVMGFKKVYKKKRRIEELRKSNKRRKSGNN